MKDKKWITTEQMLEALKYAPNNEQEYRRVLGGILFSTHWFLYDSQKKEFGESMNWFDYDTWYTESEILHYYAGAMWYRDA